MKTSSSSLRSSQILESPFPSHSESTDGKENEKILVDDRAGDGFTGRNVAEKEHVQQNPIHKTASSPIATDQILAKIKRSWNDEFQKITEGVFTNDPLALTMLRELCAEFAAVASRLGTIIISERFVDDSQRTIPPITHQIGGIAGGEKYIVMEEGIFFKFAIDQQGLYGGDEYIMKSAGLELKSLLELTDCRVAGLHFPLMVLVDYRGYRLIAMPLLPVGSDTLIYGSHDGGKSVHADNPDLNARMKLAASFLNLKGHDIWNADQTQLVTIHGPLDIEGHHGRDGRFYILDTARLFPPSIPVKGLKGCHLFRLLRPELVRSNIKPLCSDAFSSWPIQDIDAMNDDVIAAVRRLESEIIPQFASHLDDLFSDPLRRKGGHELESGEIFRWLKTEVHRRGINLRYLGLLKSYTTDDYVSSIIMTEIVARTCRSILHGRMRNLKLAEESHYVQLIVDYYNQLFDPSLSHCHTFWCDRGFKNSILKRFCNALFESHRQPSFDLRSLLLILPLFFRLNELMGLEIDSTTHTHQSISDFLNNQPRTHRLIRCEMIKSMETVHKSIHYIDFAEGTVLSKQATKATENAQALFVLAEEKYQASLMAKPDDYRALHNWGISLSYRAKSCTSLEESNDLVQQAIEKYQAALILNPRDSFAFYLWGNLLSEQALRHSAEEKIRLIRAACAQYQRSYDLNPDVFQLLYNWGNAILELAKHTNLERDYSESCAKYQKAASLTPDSSSMLLNWAISLSKHARCVLLSDQKDQLRIAQSLFEQSEQKFSDCIRLDPPDKSEVFFNWGNVAYHQARLCDSIGNNKVALKHLDNAMERFFSAMECNRENLNAYINCAKIFELQVHFERRYRYRVSLVSTASVDLFLKFFKSAVEMDPSISFSPLAVLASTKHKEVSAKARKLLEDFQESEVTIVSVNAKGVLSKVDSTTNRGTVVPSRIPSHPASSSISSTRNHPVSTVISSSNSACSVPGSTSPNRSRRSEVSMTKKIFNQLKERNSNDRGLNPRLEEFEILTAIDKSPNEFRANLRGSSQLFVMKIKARKDLDCTENGEKTQLSLRVILERGIPFVSDIQYFFPTDLQYFFIYEFISDEKQFMKQMQNFNFSSDIFAPHSSSSSPSSPRSIVASVSSIGITSNCDSIFEPNTEEKKGNEKQPLPPQPTPPFSSLSTASGSLRTASVINDPRSLDMRLKLISNTVTDEEMDYEAPRGSKSARHSSPKRPLKRSSSDTRFPPLLGHVKALELPASQSPIKTLPIEENLVKFYAAEIVVALGSIHKHGFVYGFLNINSIFLDNQGHIRLIEFNFRQEGELITSTDTFVGYAPETVANKRLSKANDWWSLGYLLFELLIGRSPLVSEEVENQIPPNLSSEARSIILGLLNGDPEKRLGSLKGRQEVSNHSFFNGLAFDSIEAKTAKVPFKPSYSVEKEESCFQRAQTIEAKMQPAEFHWFSFNEVNMQLH